MYHFRFFGASVLVALLAACGGGGTSGFTPSASSGVANNNATNGQTDSVAAFTRSRLGEIYVANLKSNTVTVYDPNGSGPVLTIKDDLNGPLGVAVDAVGKVYVTNYLSNSVTTYNANGKKIAPTIKGLHIPNGVAVDRFGKIYVTDSNGLTTYNANGTPTTPKIAAGGAGGVAVDANGKIYLLAGSGVRTYASDGTHPAQIISGLNGPSAVAVNSAGNVYVTTTGFLPDATSGNGITVYNPADGSTKMIVALNISTTPEGVAVGSDGTIYVTIFETGYVLSYDHTGKSLGSIKVLDGPIGIALH